MLRIFIDADGCPVKEETYKVAARYQLKVFIVANRSLNIPLHPTLEMITVKAGADVADDWIAENIEKDDICITTDIPLADRCLKKEAKVLGARGDEFTEDMIGDALATRDLLKELRDGGMVGSGPPPFDKRDRSEFLNALDRIIQGIKKKNK